MSDKGKSIEAMADLLRQGATLTDLSCPACSSPLFKRRRGGLWCAKCRKRVIVMKEGESASVSSPTTLPSLESTILSKIREVERKIVGETDLDRIDRLGAILSTLLENLEKVRKIRSISH